VSGARIDSTPEPTPEEAEAIRRALAALGLLDSDPAGWREGPGVRPRLSGRDGSVTVSTPYLTP
jgi:hypothetical protein